MRVPQFSQSCLTLSASALLAVLSGCAVGPNFKPPAAPEAKAVLAQPLPAQTVAVPGTAGDAQRFLAGLPVDARWWTQYGSPKLDAIVDTALANSPTVASAQAALRQAQENFRAQRAGLFPTVDGSAYASRQKYDSSSFSSGSFGGSGGSTGNTGGGTTGGTGGGSTGGTGGGSSNGGFSTGGGNIYNLFNASVDVSYTLDLFGGVRRGIEAEAAQVEAQQFQLEGTYQTLIANVVTSAVTEARLRRLKSGQYRVIDDYERQVKITNARFEAGAIGRADTLSAISSVASARATLVTFELQLAQVQNQLAVYLGQLPTERATTDFELEELKLPTDIPLTLPSELVRQRPDVRAAEAQLHAASANVGVATANLFPQLTLSASYGTQANKADRLFHGDIWSLAANLTQPIFRGGELTARRRAAIAAYDEAAADYRSTVVNAFQNVADALFQVEADARLLEQRMVAADNADRYVKLTEAQYKLGGVGYVNLLTAEQQYLVAFADLVNAQAARQSDTAALFQALGGGWWNREAPLPQAAASSQPIFP